MSDESLITAVSECPVLYDLTLKAYHDLTKRNQAWRDISSMLGVTAEVSRKKWKYLRDKYLRERKAERDRKKSGAGATSFKRWKYMAIMGFLELHVKERVSSSNMEQGDYSRQEIAPEILALLAPSMSPQREVVAQSEEEISPPSPSLSESAVDTSPPSPPTTSTVTLVTPLRPVPPPPRRRQLEQPLSAFQKSILSSIQKEKENTMAVDKDEHFMLSLVPSLRRLSNQKRAQARMRMQQVLYDVEFGE
ncbi:transcription factor Adf-1-like [Gadus chalcogrammus]|uniref:transcription factor Adf-1-like n=1 Tax=Gadus chalcogrammus TaxID=1042646 RepID=UPI0024C49ED7|nr:transcription factor Adf-1-like [Gadus chalcogrammus]XP_056465397.1 transcription factor Adf-1-like [Gadus chalcogrammus]XP_056467529.1 transcription factor Adf-1-like [Gadus chalcogrammus]XP_056467947.1 transcription factor Adf-1-like [Gadus chalcogrammus]